MQVADLPVLNLIRPIREPFFHIRAVFLFVERDYQISLLEILGLHLNGGAMIIANADTSAPQPVDGVLGNDVGVVSAQDGGDATRIGQPVQLMLCRQMVE